MKKKLLFLLILVLISATVYARKKENQFEIGFETNYNSYKLAEINEHLVARNKYLDEELLASYSYWKSNSLEQFNNSRSYLLEMNYLFNDKLALGTQLEQHQFNTKYTISDVNKIFYNEVYDLDLTGVLAQLTYSQFLFPLEKPPRVEDSSLRYLWLNFDFGLGYYYSTLNWEQEFDFSSIEGMSSIVENNSTKYTGSTIGAKISSELEIPITDNIICVLGVGYRYLVFSKLTNDNNQPFYSIYDGNAIEDKFDFSGLESGGGLKIAF